MFQIRRYCWYLLELEKIHMRNMAGSPVGLTNPHRFLTDTGVPEDLFVDFVLKKERTRNKKWYKRIFGNNKISLRDDKEIQENIADYCKKEFLNNEVPCFSKDGTYLGGLGLGLDINGRRLTRGNWITRQMNFMEFVLSDRGNLYNFVFGGTLGLIIATIVGISSKVSQFFSSLW